MNTTGRKKIYTTLFIIILTLQCITVIIWGMHKEGFNVDEMFTLEGSKHGGYSMFYWDIQENFYGNEHSGKEFKTWLTTYPEELLIYQGFDTIIDALTTREFYYALINLATSIFPSHLTHWIGVLLNIPLFIFSQIILYFLSKKINGNLCALLTTGIYGFSAGAVSTVLYIRCYMLLTLLSLTTIMLYLKFAELRKKYQRICAIVGFYILLFISYRVHQFGIILFILITGLFFLYFIIKKDKSSVIWLISGYGIPILVGWSFFYKRAVAFLSGGVAKIFWSTFTNNDIHALVKTTNNLIMLFSEHLLASKRLAIFLFFMLTVFTTIKFIKNINKFSTIINHNFLLIILFTLIILYFSILIVGGAMNSSYSWKYISPMYPIIALIIVSTFIKIISDSKISNSSLTIFLLFFIIITFISYKEVRISELYIGEKAIRTEITEKYNNWNGIMVQCETSGEISLYRPAFLWPDNAQILVVKRDVFESEIKHYARTDDKILLWLTVDYDHNEIISKLKANTDYQIIEPAFSTSYLYAYECKKIN